MVNLLTILQILFSIIVVSLSTYSIITSDHQLSCLVLFFLGLLMLIMGIKDFQRERKVSGWFHIGVFLFSVFVSIEIFFK
ncbi:DUF3953 domain-containing protein [Lysinibacillus irui]|uniref:DUF3953 domain-containing protein n=1 Tax=Lysinibacillus irui TaxID=2998077 RepID=UPI0040447504